MHPTWYGRFPLQVDSSAFWQTGPFRLWAHRSAREWKVASAQGRDPFERSLLVEVPSDRREPPQGSKLRRIGYQTTPEELIVKPVLADRPVVVTPEEPFHVPPDEKITVFISTPVWVEVSLGDSSVPVLDEPTHRPTDTWFGQSPMKGELSYATRTAARMNLDNVPSRPHRVISVVDIKNRAKIMEILFEVADRNPLVLDNPRPQFCYDRYEDSGLEVRFGVWVAKENIWKVRNSIRLEIKDAFDREDIEIPFPHRTLYAGSVTEPFPVRMVGSEPGPAPDRSG